MTNEKIKVELTEKEWSKINTALKIAKEYMNDSLKSEKASEWKVSSLISWYEESLQMLETIGEEINKQVF